jgi:hypothetical protein
VLSALRILGVDPGVAESGLCLLDTGSGPMDAADCPSSAITAEGLALFCRNATINTLTEQECFKSSYGKPLDLIAVEGMSQYARPCPTRTSFGIGKVVERVHAAGAALGVPVVEITRCEVCLHCTGRRNPKAAEHAVDVYLALRWGKDKVGWWGGEGYWTEPKSGDLQRYIQRWRPGTICRNEHQRAALAVATAAGDRRG